MQLAVCAETVFADLPLSRRMAAIREAGVASIELWGVGPERMSEVERGLHSSGCRLEIFSGNRHHSPIDPSERDGFLAELQGNLNQAVALSCPRVMLLSDKVDGRGIPIPPAHPLSVEQRFESMLECLTGAVALADAANISLLIEPLNTKVDHPGYTLCHSAPAFELVRKVGSPRLKVLYDVYHMQIMEGNLISTMEANLGEIGHIHVADVPGRHEPGTGEIHYPSIAGMLRDKGYRGCVGLECFPQSSATIAVKAFASAFR